MRSIAEARIQVGSRVVLDFDVEGWIALVRQGQVVQTLVPNQEGQGALLAAQDFNGDGFVDLLFRTDPVPVWSAPGCNGTNAAMGCLRGRAPGDLDPPPGPGLALFLGTRARRFVMQECLLCLANRSGLLALLAQARDPVHSRPVWALERPLCGDPRSPPDRVVPPPKSPPSPLLVHGRKTSGELRGRVVDANGRGLPGVELVLRHSGQPRLARGKRRGETWIVRIAAKATTDARGRFSVVAPNDGYYLHVCNKGQQRDTRVRVPNRRAKIRVLGPSLSGSVEKSDWGPRSLLETHIASKEAGGGPAKDQV